MSLVNAELTKIAVNTYVTMKISYANTLADICERLPGADVESVTDALGLDTRIGGKYLRGAIALRRAVLPARQQGVRRARARARHRAPLAEATDAINDAQTRAARAASCTPQPETDDAVGILGLAYKPDTGVVEESPGLALAALLARTAYARSTCTTRRDRRGASALGQRRPRVRDRPTSCSSAPTWS